ncbi:MAG: hypothetical protein ACI4VQ_06670 [Clostridia bacterium]
MAISWTDVKVYFLLFIIYSIAGWCLEVTCKLIQDKKFVNRGFLIGPYCPIYGCGALLITFLLKKYVDDPFTLFIMAIVLCGTLEYLTSYFMEKIFKARWWDYSKRKFNLNGRICLGTIIPFGILGLLITYVTNPFLLNKLRVLSELWLNILFWTVLSIYIIDNIVSQVVVRYIRKVEKDTYVETDNTEEITRRVKELLTSKSPLHRRLVNAYPSLQAVKIKIKEKKEKIKVQVEEQKKDLEEKARMLEEKVGDTTKKLEKKVKNVTEKKNKKEE